MTQADQMVAFELSLDALVDLYANEFDLSYVEMVGVLTVKTHELASLALAPDEVEDEDEEWSA